MRRLMALAVAAIAMGFGLFAHAEQDEYDPSKVSDSLRAIFQFGSSQTKQALNENTVTCITGTIGGTYVQIGADLASVLDDGNNLRVLPIVGRGSVQSVADILFLQGVDIGIVRADTLDYLERKGFAKDIKKQFTYVTKLYNEEMQIIAPKSINTLRDLEGKTVSVPDDVSHIRLIFALVARRKIFAGGDDLDYAVCRDDIVLVAYGTHEAPVRRNSRLVRQRKAGFAFIECEIWRSMHGDCLGIGRNRNPRDIPERKTESLLFAEIDRIEYGERACEFVLACGHHDLAAGHLR